ncbi:MULTISPECIES: hypothetical protein [unclassified Sphingomonas]|uniref:hypothetical protein n=1 Tax=unclassified Sphingomonas TaxID=196159 RepID=UPI0012E14065|nr:MULTISPECIES: hypothetical protein [unclassified Sphingomonas]
MIALIRGEFGIFRSGGDRIQIDAVRIEHRGGFVQLVRFVGGDGAGFARGRTRRER